LRKAIADLKSEATSGKEQYAHIPADQLQSIVTEGEHAITTLNEGGKLSKFESRKKTDNPPFRTSDINMRNQNLSSFAMKILTKPKPAPPKEEKKPEEKKPEEKKPEEKKSEEAKPDDGKAGEKTADGKEPANNEAMPKLDPMDTAD